MLARYSSPLDAIDHAVDNNLVGDRHLIRDAKADVATGTHGVPSIHRDTETESAVSGEGDVLPYCTDRFISPSGLIEGITGAIDTARRLFASEIGIGDAPYLLLPRIKAFST